MPSSSAHDSYMSPSIAHLTVQENAKQPKQLCGLPKVIAWNLCKVPIHCISPTLTRIELQKRISSETTIILYCFQHFRSCLTTFHQWLQFHVDFPCGACTFAIISYCSECLPASSQKIFKRSSHSPAKPKSFSCEAVMMCQSQAPNPTDPTKHVSSRANCAKLRNSSSCCNPHALIHQTCQTSTEPKWRTGILEL